MSKKIPRMLLTLFASSCLLVGCSTAPSDTAYPSYSSDTPTNLQTESTASDSNTTSADSPATEDAVVTPDTTSDTDNTTAGTSASDLTSCFYREAISDSLFSYINGKSYKTDCTIPLDELQHVCVLYYGFDGETHQGELIVNTAIADDTASMEANNTSAFNYRCIANSSKLSNHSMGLAIDINPLYNPYVKTLADGSLLVEPASGAAYADRTADNPYQIDETNLCYQLFTEHGFTWGGSWNSSKDYQHFEKAE